jgi:hypothetical protein
LIEERIGNILELIGISKKFLNGTPATQQLRDSINKWDLIKLKSFRSTKEMVSKLKREKEMVSKLNRVGENICQLHIRQRTDN